MLNPVAASYVSVTSEFFEFFVKTFSPLFSPYEFHKINMKTSITPVVVVSPGYNSARGVLWPVDQKMLRNRG